MIQLHARFTPANRAEIEAEIERLIALLDAADGDTDLEPEPDDGCLAGDDGLHPIVRNGVRFWGYELEGVSPVLPRYGVNQAAGPINERETHREHHRRTMRGDCHA